LNPFKDDFHKLSRYPPAFVVAQFIALAPLATWVEGRERNKLRNYERYYTIEQNFFNQVKV